WVQLNCWIPMSMRGGAQVTTKVMPCSLLRQICRLAPVDSLLPSDTRSALRRSGSSFTSAMSVPLVAVVAVNTHQEEVAVARQADGPVWRRQHGHQLVEWVGVHGLFSCSSLRRCFSLLHLSWFPW